LCLSSNKYYFFNQLKNKLFEIYFSLFSKSQKKKKKKRKFEKKKMSNSEEGNNNNI